MRFEIDLPSPMPFWIFSIMALAVAWVWYGPLAIIIKILHKRDHFTDKSEAIFVWLFSPVMLVLFVFYLVGGSIVWALSFGLVPSPWSVIKKDFTCGSKSISHR